ncbi:MAG: hypothetical protein ACYC77_03525 [Coriobacteriia bacterium]
MLFLRIGLAIGFQCLFALGHLALGVADPWREAADWWITSFMLSEFINLWLLARSARAEGVQLRDIYNPSRTGLGKDLAWLVLALVVSAPLGYLPNLLLAKALWGDPQVSVDLIFGAIPVAAAWVTVIVFPVIHAFTELPTYFGYVMPRLQAVTGKKVWPLLACAAVLSAQHVFLPLLFDWRFVVWRLLMFLPFALWMGFVAHRRPTVMPYLVAGHVLLDFSLPIFILLASIKAA